MEGGGAGARIADSSAFAICGVNLFQLRAGVTESHDCLPGLRLSGNLRELQSSFNGSWRFLTDGGKTNISAADISTATPGLSSRETEKHGVRVKMSPAGCSLCQRTRHADLLNRCSAVSASGNQNECGHHSCLLHQNQRTLRPPALSFPHSAQPEPIAAAAGIPPPGSGSPPGWRAGRGLIGRRKHLDGRSQTKEVETSVTRTLGADKL